MSLADARIEAAKIRAMARDGVDIQVSLEDERQRRAAAIAQRNKGRRLPNAKI
jgi:hypothetical protein